MNVGLRVWVLVDYDKIKTPPIAHSPITDMFDSETLSTRQLELINPFSD